MLIRIFDGCGRPSIESLTLENIAMVKGFYVNIISESLLREANVWYSGYDYSLRFRTLEKSVIVSRLLRKHNLTFLKYKPLSSYVPA